MVFFFFTFDQFFGFYLISLSGNLLKTMHLYGGPSIMHTQSWQDGKTKINRMAYPQIKFSLKKKGQENSHILKGCMCGFRGALVQLFFFKLTIVKIGGGR